MIAPNKYYIEDPNNIDIMKLHPSSVITVSYDEPNIYDIKLVN